jgi:hypothetical protein
MRFTAQGRSTCARLPRSHCYSLSENGAYELSEIYNWFTEGFDTADLKDAKVLLDELSG